MSEKQAEWEYEWFFITLIPNNLARDGRKLFTINDKGFKLGKKHRIKWNTDLNTYVFSPGPKIGWNAQSLKDLAGFLDTLNKLEDQKHEVVQEEGLNDLVKK